MAPSSFSVSAGDGRPLAAHHWTPPPGEAPVGVVVLIHGMGEHIRRYDHVAEALDVAGFDVYGYDHRGHGQSRRPDEAPGNLGPQGWAGLIGDIGLVVAEARSRHPDLPLTLVAHSMGSFAVQQFLLTRGGEVDAVALTGTAALDLLEPLFDLSSDIDLSAFNAPFAPARTDFDWLSRDEAAVDAYISDPDCGSGIDAQSAQDMFVGARQLADPTRVALIPAALPIYVAVGSMDPVNGGLTLLWPLVDRLRAAGVDDVTVRVYDDARHELFNETNRTAVLDDLVQWARQMAANLPANAIDASVAGTTDEGER
ncbi:alpha/beta fold hydrolase [Mycolicibacterium hodleri]|uniref:Alpha/beta hydrolase n=1 Tax=Mycolicibacterium hodleri TaxID=49897 RepID=A0A502EJ20_9MYCO|nr:alpha/beta hydrolase [Mycolicibacterium hodleri]TPG36496.1 alpha/beta hydrolase [Mycolicibacterium hodleri]